MDVLTLNDDLLVTMSFLNPTNRVDSVQSKMLHVPQMDGDMAIKWNVKAEYLAVSENLMETPLVTGDLLDKCNGSCNYGMCLEQLAAENKNASCPTTLYIANIMDVLLVCDTVLVPLPLKVKTSNLGYRVWLITSAPANFEFKKLYMDATTLTDSETVKGCSICLITKECGEQLS